MPDSSKVTGMPQRTSMYAAIAPHGPLPITTTRRSSPCLGCMTLPPTPMSLCSSCPLRGVTQYALGYAFPLRARYHGSVVVWLRDVEMPAQRIHRAAMLLDGLALRRCELDGHRLQQELRRDCAGAPFRDHALEEHALVGGVLVNHIHAIGAFGDDLAL